MANGTDFLGPYTVNVASAPFKHSPFTGGNHGYKDSGSTTDPENTPTGRMVSFEVFADGVAVEDGYSGYAQTITFKWVNMVQAANTVQMCIRDSIWSADAVHYHKRANGDPLTFAFDLDYQQKLHKVEIAGVNGGFGVWGPAHYLSLIHIFAWRQSHQRCRRICPA